MSRRLLPLVAATALAAIPFAAYAQSSSGAAAEADPAASAGAAAEADPSAEASGSPATPATPATPASPSMGPATSAGPESSSVGAPADATEEGEADASAGEEEPSAAPGAAGAAPSSPSMDTTTSSGASSSAVGAAGSGAVTAGLDLKDNTGAVVGQISDVKTDASGNQVAVITMGDKSFSVAASSLAVQDGAAVINLTQSQLQDMISKAGGPSS